MKSLQEEINTLTAKLQDAVCVCVCVCVVNMCVCVVNMFVCVYISVLVRYHGIVRPRSCLVNKIFMLPSQSISEKSVEELRKVFTLSVWPIYKGV